MAWRTVPRPRQVRRRARGRGVRDRVRRVLRGRALRGVGNGTDALELGAGAASGSAQGDEVIVPTNTFVATAEAVCAVGATPRFVDVLPDTLLLDPAAAAAAIGPAHGGDHRRAPVRADGRRRGAVGHRRAARPGARRGRRAGPRRRVRRAAGRAAGAPPPRSASIPARTSAPSVTAGPSCPTTPELVGPDPVAGRPRPVRERPARSTSLVGRNSRLDSLQAAHPDGQAAGPRRGATRPGSPSSSATGRGCRPGARRWRWTRTRRRCYHLAVVQVPDRAAVTRGARRRGDRLGDPLPRARATGSPRSPRTPTVRCRWRRRLRGADPVAADVPDAGHRGTPTASARCSPVSEIGAATCRDSRRGRHAPGSDAADAARAPRRAHVPLLRRRAGRRPGEAVRRPGASSPRSSTTCAGAVGARWSLDGYLAALDGAPTPRRSYLLTIDDGHESAVAIVAPMLAEAGVPVRALRLPGTARGPRRAGPRYYPDEPLAVRATSSRTLHGCWHGARRARQGPHPDVRHGRCRPATARRRGACDLEAATAVRARAFAYPYGTHDAAARRCRGRGGLSHCVRRRPRARPLRGGPSVRADAPTRCSLFRLKLSRGYRLLSRAAGRAWRAAAAVRAASRSCVARPGLARAGSTGRRADPAPPAPCRARHTPEEPDSLPLSSGTAQAFLSRHSGRRRTSLDRRRRRGCAARVLDRCRCSSSPRRCGWTAADPRSSGRSGWARADAAFTMLKFRTMTVGVHRRRPCAT